MRRSPLLENGDSGNEDVNEIAEYRNKTFAGKGNVASQLLFLVSSSLLISAPSPDPTTTRGHL